MTRKRCCVFTMARNEKKLLPIWLKYYSKIFDKCDIYVLDHDSDDGSIQECLQIYGFNIVQLHHEYYDEIWKRDTVRAKQVELLQSYEYVLYTDVDELVVPDPEKYRDLKDYIARSNADSVVCTGYNVIHISEEEPSIDLNRPVLEQRRYWYRDYFYDKTLLSRKPLQWSEGFHSTTDAIDRRDKDLWLIHLHKLDFDLCWDKHKRLAGSRWSDETVKKEYSWHLRITSPEDFTKFYYTNLECSKKLRKNGWRIFFLRACFFICWMMISIARPGHKAWDIWSQFHIPVIKRIPESLIRSKIF